MQELPDGYRLLEEVSSAPGSRVVRAENDTGEVVWLAVLDLPSTPAQRDSLMGWIGEFSDHAPDSSAGNDGERVWLAAPEGPPDLDRTILGGEFAVHEVPGQLHDLMQRARIDQALDLQAELRGLLPTRIDSTHTVALNASRAEGAAPGLDASPGSELFAGFRIDGTLGKGGMGVVYRAWDPRLERPVAIKMVLSEFLGPAGKERFLSEARAASRINHPNVVTVYSAGEVDDNPYMAMELVQGENLRELMVHDRLKWRQAVRWAADLLDGLVPLHEQGILHRDIKPDNVLVTPGGVVKLVDFGLAKGAGAVDPGGLMGTVFYMSPEQARAEEVTASTDVFSMGVLLYEMLSGEMPFTGDNVQSVIHKVCNVDAAPLQIEGGLPVEVELTLARALAKHRANRFATAIEFRDELLQILHEDEATARINRRRWILGSIAAVLLVSALGISLVSRFMEPEVDRAWVEQFNDVFIAQLSLGDIEEARVGFEAILNTYPEYELAWNNLALLEASQGELAVADSLLRRAIDLDPGYGAAWFNRALVYEDLGRIEEAEAFYREAIRVEPEFGYAYNNLGYLLMEQSRLVEADSVLMAGRVAIPVGDRSAPYLARTSGRLALLRGDGRLALQMFNVARSGLTEENWVELDSLIVEARRMVGKQ